MFKKRREGGSISEFAPTSLSSVYYHFNKSLSQEGRKVKEIHKINSLKLLWEYTNTLFKNL